MPGDPLVGSGSTGPGASGAARQARVSAILVLWLCQVGWGCRVTGTLDPPDGQVAL